MLLSLNIKNYALIKELTLEPDKSLNIITGETGAGKSILLGAIGLLTGNRADTKALYDDQQKCIIEGTFLIKKLNLKTFFEENDIDYEDHTIIRREIVPSGKSRAFINDTPVNLSLLKELGVQIMDIHSQHETLLLKANTFQLGLIDSYAQNNELINNFSNSYNQYRKAQNQLEKLKNEAQTLKNELDYNSFILSELEAVELENIDLEQLESDQKVLENAEEIKSKLSDAFAFLNNDEISIIHLLREVQTLLNSVSGLSPKYKELSERVKSSFIELIDISHEIEVEDSNIDTDEAGLLEISDKLSSIYNLQKKHNTESLEELINLRNELSEKVSSTLNLSEDIEKLEVKVKQVYQAAVKDAEALSKSRRDNLKAIESLVIDLLQELGMPNADFRIQMEDKEMSIDGKDTIDFLFSANKGIAPKSLKDVASGGEFSRLMLALKYILAMRTDLPTIIFDEIDTGVSGEIAVKMGKLLQEMATHLQVITITHLPQIAGKGKSHFYVYKDDSSDKTVSKIRKLNQDERIEEIATMIGGLNPSANAIKSAKELLLS